MPLLDFKNNLDVPHAENLRLPGWIVMRAHSVVHDTWGDWNKLPNGRVASHVFSYSVYKQPEAENRTLEDLQAFKETGMNATIRGEAQRVRTEMVSGNYYSVLGVRHSISLRKRASHGVFKWSNELVRRLKDRI